jgi:hypothetical protein
MCGWVVGSTIELAPMVNGGGSDVGGALWDDCTGVPRWDEEEADDE